MPTDVLMPLIGEDEDEEGVVTAWLVDDGERVDVGQLIATVQVEKVAADVEAPVAGVVRGRVELNEPVRQGAPICTIHDGAGEVAPSPGERSEGTVERRPEPPARVVASPAAKRVARELGVDLATVRGTGPDGRITEADVQDAAGSALGGGRLEGLRGVIARNMLESVRTTAPVTLTMTVDVTGSLSDRVTPRILKATALALIDHPRLNGVRDGDRFVPGGSPDIALAIQTDEGLVAPVVRGPAERTLDEITADVESLAQRARTKQLSADDYRGATFTVTNLGSYGVEAFTPIIDLPQVAILGVGAIRTVPGFDAAGAVVARREMTLSLTFDHAFVDGAPAAEFLAHLRGMLEGS